MSENIDLNGENIEEVTDFIKVYHKNVTNLKFLFTS